jgi:hypothetical protein
MTIVCPANPYLVCVQCRAPVDYFSHMGDGEGPKRNEPCGHSADIHSTDPGWNPVDGPINDRCPHEHDPEQPAGKYAVPGDDNF